MSFSTATGVTRLIQVPSAPRARGGSSSRPLEQKAAEGNTPLSQKQAAAVLGAPVPIVFCRRVTRDGITSGGVLISPPATECRFENDTSNTLTAYYRLLLSEGRLAAVQVRDVFQISCRVGTHAQAYNGPAGSWTAGNFMADRAGFTEQECPSICGGGGSYLDLSSLSFQCNYPNGDTTWDQQIHVFIRSGTEVTRLIDNVTGPSNNLADLMLLALQRSSQVPARLIDTSSLLAAAKFMEVNGLLFDGIIRESHNLEDYLSELAPKFLVRETKVNGRFGLRPLLPTTSTGAIDTGTIDWAWQFTENEVADRFEITWTPLSERRPYCTNMTWRQQPDDDIGLIRTFPYRSNGLAENGPYESVDISAFGTTENHAVKLAAHDQAARRHRTHTLALDVIPGPWSSRIAQGDIVRVILPRRTEEEGTSWHDFLYEVEQVEFASDGGLGLDLVHFPVNSKGQSLVALAVANAVGTGILLPTGRTGPSCDTNSGSSTSAVSRSIGSGNGGIYTSQGITVNDLMGNPEETEEAQPGGTTSAPAPLLEDGGVVGEPVNKGEPKVDRKGGQLFGGGYIIIIGDGGAEYENTYKIRRTWVGISPRVDNTTITLSNDERLMGIDGGQISNTYGGGQYGTQTLDGTRAKIFNRKTGAERTQNVWGGEILGIFPGDLYTPYAGPQPAYDVTATKKGTSEEEVIFDSTEVSDF